MSVNADKLVQIVPRIIAGGTQGLKFNGLFLTKSTLPPSGRVLQFSSAQSVAHYFGPLSVEASVAQTYFKGYINTSYLPDSLYFAAYRDAPVGAWLRSAEYIGTLAQLTAITDGTLDLTINGTAVTLTGVSLASATSYSEVAATLQTALAAVVTGTTVAYSSDTNAWQINAPSTGPESTITYPTPTDTGTDLAAALGLTEQQGGILSPGIAAQTLSSCLESVLNYAREWVSFSTCWELETAQKIEAAQWCASYSNRFLNIFWDTDIQARTPNSTASAGYQISKVLNLSGSLPIFNTVQLAAWAMGTVACINFDQYNGRLTLAFRQGDGVIVTCDNNEDYDALIANGYNVYADFATASSNLKFFQPGQASGTWQWADTYINSIAIKDGLQLNLLDLFAAVRSIPYNEEGYAMVRTACLDTIDRFVRFGAIRPGVKLSQAQKVQLLSEVGRDISNTLETQGWYMLVQDPGSTVRAARGTPDCKFYYMDGGSIQRIVMPATAIQ